MAETASSSVAAGSRPYGGVSATDRRHQRRLRLIDAGLQLFGTRGIAAVGIVDVCAEAGLTKRYFYENFASIDALAEAVFEHVTGNLVAMVAPAIEIGAGRDPRPALTVYIRALLSDPRVVRLLAVGPRPGHSRSTATDSQRAQSNSGSHSPPPTRLCPHRRICDSERTDSSEPHNKSDWRGWTDIFR